VTTTLEGPAEELATESAVLGHQVREFSELAVLRRQVRELTDRAAISELIDRYVVLLDTQDENGFDESWPRTVFTEDVRLHFPIGTHEGLAGVAEFHLAAKQKFDRTLHLSANHAVRLDGDRAQVRFHLIATHVHHDGGVPLFDIGGHYTGEAVRTAAGWRFREWGFHLTWASGPGPDGEPVM
jgi:hypothetical protein